MKNRIFVVVECKKINNTIERLPANFFQAQTKIKKGVENVLNSSVDKII